MCIWPYYRFSTPKWPFLTPKWPFSTLMMTFDDFEMHIIRIRIKFRIDSYAYHVHLAIFSIFDPKMTFFDPLYDLGWPRDTHHWIKNKISNRSMCISCAFGHFSDFWPQNDLFWPLRWPRMTLRRTPLNSEKNFQSIHMHIMHIGHEKICPPLFTPFIDLKRLFVAMEQSGATYLYVFYTNFIMLNNYMSSDLPEIIGF